MKLFFSLSQQAIIKRQAIWLLTSFVGVWVFIAGCDPWRESYLKNGVETITQEEIEKKFGSPFRTKESLLDEEAIWIYRFAFMGKDLEPMGIDTLGKGITDVANAAAAMVGKSSGGQAVEKPICLHYILTFDKAKVLRDWKRETC